MNLLLKAWRASARFPAPCFVGGVLKKKILVVYIVHVLVVYTSSKKYSTRPRHARNASPELCPPLYCSKRQANTAKETYVRVTRQKRPMRVAQRPIMSGVRRPSRA